jgi:hypothetical protein
MPNPESSPPKSSVRLTGFPGEGTGIVAAPHYIGDKAHLNAIGPNGAPGLYTVTFVLAKPNSRNSPENEIKFADLLRGDSHLAITKPAVNIPIDPDHIILSFKSATTHFKFRGYPNERGYLAKLVTDPFHANGRVIAESAATSAAHRLLSNLSAHLDVPLIVEIVEVTEVITMTRGISFTAPFPIVPMAILGEGSVKDPEFEHAIALYREALSSNTPIYRYLCFYKILEMSRKRRERLGKKHKKALNPVRPGEQIPLRDNVALVSWLNAIFHINRDWDEMTLDQIFVPEVIGKKINNVFDSQLRPIRDKVAHGILDSGEFLFLDRSDDRLLVTRWLPFIRCAARRVMKNDFPDCFLRFLNEEGTVSDK